MLGIIQMVVNLENVAARSDRYDNVIWNFVQFIFEKHGLLNE